METSDRLDGKKADGFISNYVMRALAEERMVRASSDSRPYKITTRIAASK